jgi:hypothetical protein
MGIRNCEIWFWADWRRHPRSLEIADEVRIRAGRNENTAREAPFNERVTELQQNPGDPRLSWI